MTAPPRRALAAITAQAPIVLVATLLVGFGYLLALLLSGRAVGTLDVVAAAAAAAVTGAAMLLTITRAARAAADRPPPPTGTRRMATDTGELRAVQGRVDRSHPARHSLGHQP